MEEVFQPYHVFINHRGPDVKKTLASLIYHCLESHGLRVFLDKQELGVGDSLTLAIKSAISSASIHIAVFSRTYAESVWCLNELLWMFDSHTAKIIPIFYDIQPSDLRYIDKGAYAGAFQGHIDKGRVTIQQVNKWISTLKKVTDISGIVISSEKDDLGERLQEIVEIVLKEVGKQELRVCEYPVGLDQAIDRFEEEVLNPCQLTGMNAVGIVGLGGSGKSTLATYLYNSKRSQFHRSSFLSDVRKNDLSSLQQTLLADLLPTQNLLIEDTRRGKTMLRHHLRGLARVLIVLDDIDNTEQIENLLFVKDVVGNGSLILVTSRDRSLLLSSEVEIYEIKLLGAKDARELFCWHAFGHNKPIHDLQDMVEKFVSICSGFPLAVKVLAGQLHNERDPRKWNHHLESLPKQQPRNILKQILMNSYESLVITEKEAFLDIAHFLLGEDTDLAEQVLDGLNGNGFQCLQTLHYKGLVEFESADIFRRRALGGESVNWSIRVWRREKGSLKIRMHDLLKELAREIGRRELPLRLCCSNDKLISKRQSRFLSKFMVVRYDVRGIRRDEDYQLPIFLVNQDIRRLKVLAVQNSTILQQFKSVSGDLVWLRLRQSKEPSNPSPLLKRSLSNPILSTLLLTSLRVLEIHVASLQYFCNLFDDHEPPSQLRALEVWSETTAVFTKHGSATEPLDSSRPSINIGQWFQEWLGKPNFKNLGKIVLQNIQGLTTLPIKFEELRHLKHVDLSGCSDLEVLPDPFTEKLLQLKYLALQNCRKLVLPDLKRISKLEYLDFQGCSKLWEMPKGTVVQKSLKHLNVVHTVLKKLPQYLEQLKELEELHIGSSELTEIPSSLYNLSRLTFLTLIGCTKLHFIDNSIEKLAHLESFRIYKCGMRALPETIAWMNVKILDVQECPLDLEQLLTGVNSRNMPLYSSQAQRSAHPKPSGCLTDLIIRRSHISEIHIPQAECLFPKLEIVDLSDNRLLKEIGSLPCSLISLNLMNCSKLKTLTCLGDLANLRALEISGCHELETLCVDGLNSIEMIRGNGCWKLQDIRGLQLLQKLSYFQISVSSSSRPERRNIVTGTQLMEFSTGVQYRKSMEEEYLDEMGINAEFSEDVKVLKVLESCTQASVEIEDCNFTDMKLYGVILLYLITGPNCKIEVAFLDHAYITDSSSSDNSVHMLMWTKDSDVFNDFKLSKDGAIHLNINVLSSNPLLTERLQKGWIVGAENVLKMSSVFHRIPATPFPRPDIT